MKTKQIFLLFITLLLISSCKNRFDPAKWKEGGVDWQITDTREKIVDDLIESDTLIGLDTNQVFSLLGKPEFNFDSTLKFLVREKYSLNVDPDYIKYLNVYIKNGRVAKCSLELIR